MIRLTPQVYLGRIPGQFYSVSEIRPEQALVLEQHLPTGGKTSWSFTLRAARTHGTRLIVRSRTSTPQSLAKRIARQTELLLLEPGYFVMERGMLRGIRKRAPHLARLRSGQARAAKSAVLRDRGVESWLGV